MQRVDALGDVRGQAGAGVVQVVALRGQAGFGERDGRAVGKDRARILAHDEAAVAPHAHHVGQAEEHVRVQVFGVRPVGAGPHEQVLQRPNARAVEGPVVSRERHDQVVQVPEPVVDGRGGQQHEVLLLAAQQPRQRAVPGRARIAQGVGLVEDDQSVDVLVVGERAVAGPRATTRIGELRVGGELLVADHLRGKPRLVQPLAPMLAQLGRHDHQDVKAAPHRVLLHERQADLGLARAHAVRVDDAPVLADDGKRATKAVVLERRQLEFAGLRRRVVFVQVVAEELQQSAQVDRPRIKQPRVGKEKFAELVLEVGRRLPERVEPLHRPLGHRRIVVNEAELQVPPKARRSQVGRRHQPPRARPPRRRTDTPCRGETCPRSAARLRRVGPAIPRRRASASALGSAETGTGRAPRRAPGACVRTAWPGLRRRCPWEQRQAATESPGPGPRRRPPSGAGRPSRRSPWPRRARGGRRSRRRGRRDRRRDGWRRPGCRGGRGVRAFWCWVGGGHGGPLPCDSPFVRPKRGRRAIIVRQRRVGAGRCRPLEAGEHDQAREHHDAGPSAGARGRGDCEGRGTRLGHLARAALSRLRDQVGGCLTARSPIATLKHPAAIFGKATRAHEPNPLQLKIACLTPPLIPHPTG